MIMSTAWSHSLYFCSSRAVSSLTSLPDSFRRVGAGVEDFDAWAAGPVCPEGPSRLSFFAFGSEIANRFLNSPRPSVEIGSGWKIFAISATAPASLPWREETSDQAVKTSQAWAQTGGTHRSAGSGWQSR